MKLKEGMYVRTNEGKITKLVEIDEDGFKRFDKFVDFTNYEITKASYNIIDLIEVGDYVNGKRVGFINDSDYYKDIFLSEDYEEPYETMIVKNYKDIKSIVTKEQFESIEYNLEG